MLNWSTSIRDFIQSHIDDDTVGLLLAAQRFADIDVPFAAEQIEARRRLKGKLPEWYGNTELIMGGRVPAEQCSSEQTARYKRGIISGESLCDMTGGMGVDLWYMSEGMRRAVYTERDERLCEIAAHNFAMLDDGRHPRVEVRHGDCRVLPVPDVDVVYLDPARRAADGSRVYAISDCEPNVLEWQDELLRRAGEVVVKLSPMVDVTDAVRRLKGVTEVHVVGVRNECKEVLVKQSLSTSLSRDAEGDSVGVPIYCVDFMAEREVRFYFNLADRQPAAVSDDGVGRYIYEPDVTIMKAGGFGVLCRQYGVAQLDYDTRLMTSDECVADFPGKCFEVKEVVPFSSKVLRRLKERVPQANVAARNFILPAEELRRRGGIKDGGDIYLFGTKEKNIGAVLLICEKSRQGTHARK